MGALYPLRISTLLYVASEISLTVDFRTAPIPNFTNTLSTKYCHQAYLQVQILILISGKIQQLIVFN